VTWFSAPWDRELRIASAILVAVLGAVAGGLLVLGTVLSRGEPDLLWPFLVGPAIAIAVLAMAWLLAPRGFALRGRDLLVERRLRPVRIRLVDIHSVGQLAPGEAARALRLGGNGGLFGHYGRFWNRRLGSFRLYATRRSGLVRVDTAEERFVLSPADPEAFVEAVLARAPRASRATSPAVPASPRAAGVRALRGIGIAATALLVAIGCIFSSIWGFAPVGVEVADDAVRVERRWAGPVELPLDGIRSAEILAPQYGRRWWRTNGTALGAVRFGRFASRELGAFRLYAWRYGPYVLLETNRGRVVLTPDQAERFVARVRERIGAR